MIKTDSLPVVLKYILLATMIFGIAAGTASAFDFRGYTYNETGGMPLDGTNITIEEYVFVGGPPSLIATYSAASNETGYFSVTSIPNNQASFYKIIIRHFNAGKLDYIGQSLPQFPYPEISHLANGTPVTFYLRPGGTININASNGTANFAFRYMVKDTRLGYPIDQNFSADVFNATVYVPRERNYSIMIYPNQSFPVSYELVQDNFTSPNYTVNITFNTSSILRRVSGYANLSDGSAGFNDLRIIGYLMEPGNMVVQDHPMPSNIGGMCQGAPFPPCQPDIYNSSNGSYAITLPGAAMNANVLLFATARNGSDYYGGFRKISLNYSNNPVTGFNFTMNPLLGSTANISVNNATGGIFNITTSKLSFQLKNGTSGDNINGSAHVEVGVDYSAYNGSAISWMLDVQQSNNGLFNIPALNANIKRINVFTQGFAPLKISKTAGQLAVQPVIINLTSFRPGAINESEAPPIFIDMLKSSPECDVPYPGPGCSLFPQQQNMSDFNPFKIVIGGGKISFRMISNNNITIHYKNVDLMASGPPDALFDSNATDSQNGSAIEQAWRFGSMGPEIYDEVLIGIPLAANVNASNVSVKLGKLYDNSWNVSWNISSNNTSEIPSDFSDFNESNPAWFTRAGMQCSTTNVAADCYVNTAARMVWLTIPHFSGIGPEISSETVGNVTATLSPNSSVASSTVNMNFTVTDTANSTSWFNITFPSGFTVVGAIVNLVINGSVNPANWLNTTGMLFVNVSTATAGADSGTVQYINISNITVPSISGTYIINVTTNNSVTVPLNYSVTPNISYGVILTNISSLANSTRSGINATYILNLTNNGTSVDTYDLAVINSGALTAALNISSPLSLNAGASKIFTLNVTNDAAGVFYVNVTAISRNNTAKVGYVNTTTSVISSPPGLNTSYWGNVTVNGALKPNANVTVQIANGIEVANNISDQNGIYIVSVPWDNLDTLADEGVVSGESITFKVYGQVAVSVTVDVQGNSTRLNLSINDTPPVITISSPLNQTYTTTSIALNVSANETISLWNYSLNGAPNITFTPNITITAIEGANNLTVYGQDGLGNWNRSTVNFTVDTIPPIITIALPQNNTLYNTTSIRLNVTASETISLWNYSLNSATNFTFTPNTTITASQGANTLKVYAKDTAGNWNSSTVGFTADTTPPVITIASPQNNAQYNTTSIPLNVSANESISAWLYNLNGTNQSFSPNTTITASQGANTLTVYANDTAGNWNKSTVAFSVDSIPPVITISYPGNNTNISIFDRTISGGITDNNSINASLSINSVPNNTWTSRGNFSWMANYTAGSNVISISANDTYGNYNLTSVIVNVLQPNSTTSHNITNNTSYNITANESTGVDLVLTAGNNSANVTVTINASINASEFNASNIVNGLGRYAEINATGDTGNLSTVKLTLFYNHSELDKDGNGAITDAGDIDESSLAIYWYWDNASAGRKWLPITAGVNYSTYLDNQGNPGPVVIGSIERNITLNYLSATLNHFSLYTLNGTVIQAPASPGGSTGSTGSSGGGGGGGGGGASAENYSNILVKEKVDMFIFKDKTTSYLFKSADPIIYVNITGNTSAGAITTMVEVLKNTSTLVKYPASGIVYKNINIWVGTSGFAVPRNIQEGIIVFKVKNSWMSDNKVRGRDVIMVKWDGSKWISLETRETSKDDTYSYFEAETDSFSPFAITTGAITPEVTEPRPEVTPKETPKVTATTPGKKKTPAIPAGLALMVIAMAAYFMRKKEGGQK